MVCYLARGPGAAIRRARTRLPGGGQNPVAIVRVPRERMVGHGIASSLVHEVGHQAAALLELVESLRPAPARMQRRRGRSASAAAWGLLGALDLRDRRRPLVGRQARHRLDARADRRRQPAGVVRLPGQRRRPAPDAVDPRQAQLRHRRRALPAPAVARARGAVGRRCTRATGVDPARRRAPRGARGDDAAASSPCSSSTGRRRCAAGRSARSCRAPERQPRDLVARCAASWEADRAALRDAPPTLAFAVLGQARWQRRARPERESRIVGEAAHVLGAAQHARHRGASAPTLARDAGAAAARRTSPRSPRPDERRNSMRYRATATLSAHQPDRPAADRPRGHRRTSRTSRHSGSCRRRSARTPNAAAPRNAWTHDWTRQARRRRRVRIVRPPGHGERRVEATPECAPGLRIELTRRRSGPRRPIVVPRAAADGTRPLSVSLRRSSIVDTTDQPLWERHPARAPHGCRSTTTRRSSTSSSAAANPTTGSQDSSRPFGEPQRDAFQAAHQSPRHALPFPDVESYRLLKAATEAFLMVDCGVALDPASSSTTWRSTPDRARRPLGLAPATRGRAVRGRPRDDVRESTTASRRSRDAAVPRARPPQLPEVRLDRQRRTRAAGRALLRDPRARSSRNPCFLELIWSLLARGGDARPDDERDQHALPEPARPRPTRPAGRARRSIRCGRSTTCSGATSRTSSTG